MVVDEARKWLGTPYHHRQRCLGRGVDCVNLLVAVYSAVGLAPAIELPWYPHDWHLHRNAELLVETLKLYARPVRAATAGDIAVYRFGRTVSHAAIIEDDENIIHAYLKAECVDRTERSVLEARLAAEHPGRHDGEDAISSYWSAFPAEASAARERLAA